MEDKTYNVVISGVGGQGTVLASKLLSEVAARSGLDVKQSEVHGMSQRGGDVISQVRFAKKVYSPLITEGEADVLLSFELLEGLRYISYVKPDGKAIVSTKKIIPSSVGSGSDKYPDNIEDKIKTLIKDVTFVDGEQIALDIGNVRTVNIILLGALSKALPFKLEEWEEAIKVTVPPKTIDVNLKAFSKGRELVN